MRHSTVARPSPHCAANRSLTPKTLAPEIVAAIVAERLAHKRCAEVIQAALAKRGLVVNLSSVKRTLKRHELVPSRKWKRYRPPVARPPADTPGSLVQTDTIHFLDWQEWAEGFQTLDDLQSVNLTPEDEHRVRQLLSDDTDGEETVR